MREFESGKYRFIGQHNSLGLKNGEIYKLLLSVGGFPYPIEVTVISERKKCPYSSVKSFMMNWELIVDDKEATKKEK